MLTVESRDLRVLLVQRVRLVLRVILVFRVRLDLRVIRVLAV
jgi:hypothetical protein